MTDLALLFQNMSLPLSESAPCGEDIKYNDEFEKIQVEISKLNSVQGSADINWNTIAENASSLLFSKSKDITCAVYLSLALAQTQGIQGWLTGNQILLSLLTHWWDTAFPPLKRMKSRINMIDWWHEKSIPFLESITNPLEEILVNEINECANELDNFVAENMPDCMPLFDLKDTIRKLPVIKENKPEIKEEVAVPKEIIEEVMPEGKDEREAKYIEYAMGYSDSAFAESIPTDPLVWQAFYTKLWGKIKQIPPNENKVTFIPEPDKERIENLLNAKQVPQELVLSLIHTAPEYPFLMDIHMAVYKNIEQLGTTYTKVLERIAFEVYSFTQRLENILDFTFNDATPFASLATKSWLKSLQKTPSQENTEVQNCAENIDTLFLQAQSKVKEQNIEKGLEYLQSFSQGAEEEKRFLTLLVSIQLLSANKQYDIMLALIEQAEEYLGKFSIKEWQPELALKAYLILHSAWKSILKDPERTFTDEYIQTKLIFCKKQVAHINPIPALSL